MRFTPLLAGFLAIVVAAGHADAQARGEAPRRGVYVQSIDSERPVIGVNTSSSGQRDTLGLLVVSVTPGGPAEKAGIEEGHRIAEVNGVSMRLAAADAGHDDMQGLTTRRLVRELRKVEAGAEVTLRVYANGQLRTVKVKTVPAEDLPTTRTVNRGNDEDRAVLGITLTPSGSRRDTLGVLITQVTTDGPAEKAGLIEGDRIASINGIDLRVPAAEAGESALSSAKSNRFSREMRKLKAGDEVELRVYSGGQFKNVRIKTQAAEDVYDQRRGYTTFFGSNVEVPRILRAPGEGMEFVVPSAPGARVRVPTPVIPRPDVQRYHAPEPELRLQEAPRARPEMQWTATSFTPDASAPTGRSFERSPVQLPPVRQAEAREVTGPVDRRTDGFVMATGSGERYLLELPGMQLAKVGEDLAEYLGAGTDQGLLVVEVEDLWAPLRSGDVILSINGRAVRTGDAASVALGTTSANEIEIVRRGRRVTVVVDCR